jgi:cytolysin (calcineurin-like family phosphatase)
MPVLTVRTPVAWSAYTEVNAMPDEADTRGVEAISDEFVATWKTTFGNLAANKIERATMDLVDLQSFIARIDAEVLKRQEAERELDRVSQAYSDVIHGTLNDKIQEVQRLRAALERAEAALDKITHLHWKATVVDAIHIAAAALDREGEANG